MPARPTVGHLSAEPLTTKGDQTMAQLTRPREGRRIAGVCAGLARRWGVSPFLVRLLFVLSCVLPGPQFLIYIALWVVMPSE